MIESRNSDRSRKEAKIVCLIMCLFFMIVGMVFLVRDSKYLIRRFTCSEVVNAVAAAPDATVSTTGSGKKQHTHTYYHPVFNYTYRNRSYEAYYELSSDKNYYPAGKAAELHIDPDDPDTFYIADDPILRRDILENFLIFMIGAVPLALYFLATRTKLLNVRFDRNGITRVTDEEQMRLAMEKQVRRIERAAEKIREREGRK